MTSSFNSCPEPGIVSCPDDSERLHLTPKGNRKEQSGQFLRIGRFHSCLKQCQSRGTLKFGVDSDAMQPGGLGLQFWNKFDRRHLAKPNRMTNTNYDLRDQSLCP